MWNENDVSTIRITEFNLIPFAELLSNTYGVPWTLFRDEFLKPRLHTDQDVGILTSEAFCWSIHKKLEKQIEACARYRDDIQMTVDDDGDFEFVEVDPAAYHKDLDERYINKTATMVVDVDADANGSLCCPNHKKYKGHVLTERAKTCSGCTEVYRWRQEQRE